MAMVMTIDLITFIITCGDGDALRKGDDESCVRVAYLSAMYLRSLSLRARKTGARGLAALPMPHVRDDSGGAKAFKVFVRSSEHTYV
jgi:hypothetical protein